MQTSEMNGVNLKRLDETIKAIRETPAIADFKFRVENEWINGANNISKVKSFYGACAEDETRTAEFNLIADEPDVLLGTNQGPNPTEAAMHALAACITTTLVYHAAAKGYHLNAVSSTYEGDLDLHGFLGLDLNVRKGYKVIRMEFMIDGDLTREQKEEILKIGREFSPVHEMISSSVPIEVILV